MKYPFKISFKTEILPVLIIAASFLLGIYFYMHFPERVVTHWDITGQPNGFGGKFLGAFGLPALLLFVYALFLALPAFDPKSERYSEFAKVYRTFKFMILFVLLATYTFTGLYNLGVNVKVNYLVPLLVGLLFIVLGNYMGKIRNNWFMGLRNPWTMSSENVWNKTNRLGGWFMVLLGFLLMLLPFLGMAWGLGVFLGGVVVMLVVTSIYSYSLYKKEKQSAHPEAEHKTGLL